MSGVAENLASLAAALTNPEAQVASQLSRNLAEALLWTTEGGRSEEFAVNGRLSPEGNVRAVRTMLGGQPAAVFVAGPGEGKARLLTAAALFAYHSSVEWGAVTTPDQITIFNSHWVVNGDWFHLPPILWEDAASRSDVFEAITPEGLQSGRIDQIAGRLETPERQLRHVDDALVDRLDAWRAQVLRYTPNINGADEQLQRLFAQFFVLRAVEDRRLASEIPSLWVAREGPETVNLDRLAEIFEAAGERIQSELFDEPAFSGMPAFLLAGIIHDLYVPKDIPVKDARYNFAWISADVLGRAYEKYLSTLYIPVAKPSGQLPLFDQPVREVDTITVRKAQGVYYTPDFLVRYLTERSLQLYFDGQEPDSLRLPVIADISCGSGSFLVAAVDTLIRWLKDLDAERDWARELVAGRHIIGIDLDPRAVTLARLSLWLRLAEEPQPLPLPTLSECVVQGDSLNEATWANLPLQIDVEVGNPPFMPIGNVENRHLLANRFRVARGRFDYAYLFIEQAVNKLREGGVFGLVVPNRIFRNRDAAELRRLLSESGSLLSMVDFGSLEVFEGTSAYVGALIYRRDQERTANTVRFIRAYSLPPRFASSALSEAAQSSGELETEYLEAYSVPQPYGQDAWLMLSPSARRIRVLMDDRSESLSTIAGVYQGISTGANELFIVETEPFGEGGLVYVRNALGDRYPFERDLLRPVAFGSELQRYERVGPEKWLIYPYVGGEILPEGALRRDYPLAWRYFSTYRELLAARSSIIEPGLPWYGLVRKRDETWLNSKKLLTRDLALRTSFAVDELGATYLVKGVAIVPADESLLYPLLAYLNSTLVNWYLSRASSFFRADFMKFEPQHLSRVPVLRSLLEDDEFRDRLGELAIRVVASWANGEEETATAVEREIDEVIANILGIEPRGIN